jgi:hypothetical protein
MMDTRALFSRRSFWRFLGIFSLSILFTLQLAAQNSALQDELTHSLSGATLISTILFGGKAILPGQQADFPVNTLVDPTRRDVSYCVESGRLRTAIAANEMHHYFDRGTFFHLRAIDLKDDSLELKLESNTGDSAQLTLMLGAGWQSKFDNASIQSQLARVFVIDRQPQPTRRAAIPAGFGGAPIIPPQQDNASQDNASNRARADAGGRSVVSARPSMRQN